MSQNTDVKNVNYAPQMIIDEFQVPREICYNPSTGERCDNYNKQLADSYPVRC